MESPVIRPGGGGTDVPTQQRSPIVMLLANTEVRRMLRHSASSDAMNLFFSREWLTVRNCGNQKNQSIGLSFYWRKTNKQDFRSTGSSPIELVRFRQFVSAETPLGHAVTEYLAAERHVRGLRPTGSRAATLDTEGAFLAASRKADRYQPETGL